MDKITDKDTMYSLLRSGRLGNTLHSDRTLAGLRAKCSGLVGLRYSGTTSGKRWFQLGLRTDAEVNACVDRWVAEGAQRELVVFSQQAPDCTFNAELTGTAARPYVRYHADPRMACRDAMLDYGAADLRGVLALAFLRRALTAPSFEDVLDLLDAWPDHVIELTTFNQCVGWARGRNHVVWEVRHY